MWAFLIGICAFYYSIFSSMPLVLYYVVALYHYLQTVDQFFGLNLPMDITHLQALLSVIFHSLDTYLQKVISELG